MKASKLSIFRNNNRYTQNRRAIEKLLKRSEARLAEGDTLQAEYKILLPDLSLTDGPKKQEGQKNQDEIDDKILALERRSLQYYAKQKADIAKIKSLIREQENIISIAEIVLTIIGFVVIFSIAIIFNVFSPGFGSKISLQYYQTIATIYPVLFIAIFIETGIFREKHLNKLSRTNAILPYAFPMFVGLILALFSIAEEKTNTFLVAATFLLLCQLMFLLFGISPLEKNRLATERQALAKHQLSKKI